MPFSTCRLLLCERQNSAEQQPFVLLGKRFAEMPRLLRLLLGAAALRAAASTTIPTPAHAYVATWVRQFTFVNSSCTSPITDALPVVSGTCVYASPTQYVSVQSCSPGASLSVYNSSGCSPANLVLKLPMAECAFEPPPQNFYTYLQCETVETLTLYTYPTFNCANEPTVGHVPVGRCSGGIYYTLMEGGGGGSSYLEVRRIRDLACGAELPPASQSLLYNLTLDKCSRLTTGSVIVTRRQGSSASTPGHDSGVSRAWHVAFIAIAVASLL